MGLYKSSEVPYNSNEPRGGMTKKGITLRSMIKKINKSLKHPELYTDDELHHLKKKRREFLDVERRSNLEQRGGFGV
tara:strand:- start:256 stop:486 length:231 start_codon:yes stop_codon:yes gene_type:complete